MSDLATELLRYPLRVIHSAVDLAQASELQEQRYEALTVLGLTILVPVVRVGLHTTVIKPLAAYLLVDPSYRKTGQIPQKLRNRVNKACESAWKLVAYCSLAALGWYALRDQPWLWSTREYWTGWPHKSLPLGVSSYYAAEAGFYLASVFMLLGWEERRRDYPVMIVHHAVTVALIVGSHYWQYGRIGSVVMLLHDPSDVFLESAKLCGYRKLETPATALFACLLVSWLVTRLILLPFWVIWSAWFEVEGVLGYYPASNYPFVGLLCVLVCLHLYWFYLMADIAFQKLFTGKMRDSREDDDD